MRRWLFATFNAVTANDSFSPNDFPTEMFTVVWPGKCAGPPLSVNPEPYATLVDPNTPCGSRASNPALNVLR